MSTSSVTPDQSTPSNYVMQSSQNPAPQQAAPANYVEQSSQNPAPSQPTIPAAPDVSSLPPNGPRLTSALARIVGVVQPTPPPAAPATPATNTPSARPAWQTNLGKVASVVSTGLSGIPAGGRPSFMGGLGQGARAEQAAQATQQALKFKDFQSQVQIAQLHNEDLRLQNATEDHQNTVQDHADAEADRMTKTTAMTYTPVSNTAENVRKYVGADAAQNGAATVPAGIIMGPHTIYIPNKGSADQAKADTQNYNSLAPAYGLPNTPPGQVASPGVINQLRQARIGMDSQGHPMSADAIGHQIDTLQAALKSGVVPSDDAKATLQSDIANLTDLQQHHAARDQAGIDQAIANKNKQTQDTTNIQTAGKQSVIAARAANAPQKTDTTMYLGHDASGNPLAGTSDQLKASGAQGVTKMPTEEVSKTNAARDLISPNGLFNSVAQNIQALQAKGQLGVVGSRWNDFIAGKVGEGDPDFQALRTNMGLLSTKLMQAHVGSRGSSQMLEHFQHLADYRITDAPTLLSALSAEHKYMTNTAAYPKQGGQ
jgi:hypothetical protein